MPETSGTHAPRAGVGVCAYFVLLLAVLAVLAVSIVPGVRSRPGVIPFYDDWVQSAGYVLAAGAVVWRVVRCGDRRLLWSLVALALLLRAAGFLHTFFVLDRAPVYPSIADLYWILGALVLLAALILLAQRLTPWHSRALALDALIAGAIAASLSWLLLKGTLERLAAPGTPADVVTTNLAYPLIDVAMLVALAALVGATHGRLSRANGTLCLGVVVFAVVDCVFLYLVTTGNFRPGSFLAPLSLGGMVLIAASAWLPDRDRRGTRDGPAGLSTPVGLALLCVAVLAYEAVREVPAVAIVTASIGVLLAILRGYLAFTVDRRETGVVIASKDVEIERFRALVEASDDFIAIVALDGRMTYLNPGGKRLVGLPDDLDVTHTMATDYVPVPKRAGLTDRLSELPEPGTWSGHSELLDFRGGPDIPVMVNTFSLHHPQTGTPWLLATVQRDVTELRAAESELLRFRPC